jgi:DNA invertase Pin-like site-specific DNA recombinase
MAAGCAKVYGEKVSGAKTDRAELGKLLRRLEPRDVLMVTRLDRLARSTRDLLNILHQLAERGVSFNCGSDPPVQAPLNVGTDVVSFRCPWLGPERRARTS